MVKSDTPFPLSAEIHAVVFGSSAVIAFVAIAVLVFLYSLRQTSTARAIGKRAWATVTVLVSVVLMQVTAALGFMTAIEHPRYRDHMICEPCF